MKAKELKYDIEEIDNMKNKLETMASELQECKRNVNKSLTNLKVGWKTPAGKKFFEDVDIKWRDETDKYIKTINAVKELLEEASMHYETVSDTINNLKI